MLAATCNASQGTRTSLDCLHSPRCPSLWAASAGSSQLEACTLDGACPLARTSVRSDARAYREQLPLERTRAQAPPWALTTPPAHPPRMARSTSATRTHAQLTPPPCAPAGVVNLSSLDGDENPTSVTLSETVNEEGTTRIVYRPGGRVATLELEELCAKVGWPSRPTDKMEAALENSFLVCSLHLESCDAGGVERDARMIGLARCTSDHVFNATIWDVLIDPGFQGQVRSEPTRGRPDNVAVSVLSKR